MPSPRRTAAFAALPLFLGLLLVAGSGPSSAVEVVTEPGGPVISENPLADDPNGGDGTTVDESMVDPGPAGSVPAGIAKTNNTRTGSMAVRSRGICQAVFDPQTHKRYYICTDYVSEQCTDLSDPALIARPGGKWRYACPGPNG